MTNAAVRVRGLAKDYRLGSAIHRYATLREALARAAHPGRLFRGTGRKNGGTDVVRALHDLSFDISQGEVVGIIGRNGAGKSTLLKILTRVTEPTAGYAEVRGRMGALLEVGAGFHPELTGRENTYLNGVILGMTRREIDRKFDEIIEFAGLEQFVDTPVKRYSSGMYMRLAFSVAAHLDPEILVVDEVLAVGDAAFQKKCLGKMDEVAREGRTVLFVSHNLSAVRSLCTRAIWIEAGAARADGPSGVVIDHYLDTLTTAGFQHRNDRAGFAIESVRLKDARGKAAVNFQTGAEMAVEIAYRAERLVARPHFIIVVNGRHGPCMLASMLLDGCAPETLQRTGKVECRFQSLPLMPQRYSLSLEVRSADGRESIVPSQEAASFTVNTDVRDLGLHGEMAPGLIGKSCSVLAPYYWSLPEGTSRPVGLALAGAVEAVSE